MILIPILLASFGQEGWEETEAGGERRRKDAISVDHVGKDVLIFFAMLFSPRLFFCQKWTLFSTNVRNGEKAAWWRSWFGFSGGDTIADDVFIVDGVKGRYTWCIQRRHFIFVRFLITDCVDWPIFSISSRCFHRLEIKKIKEAHHQRQPAQTKDNFLRKKLGK